MIDVAYPHIEVEAGGEPVLKGTGTKVVIIAMDRIAHHWDADEIRRQRPHLSLGQIYSALAYYYDHEEEMNRRIEERLGREERLIGSLGESRVRAKLAASKGAR